MPGILSCSFISEKHLLHSLLTKIKCESKCVHQTKITTKFHRVCLSLWFLGSSLCPVISILWWIYRVNFQFVQFFLLLQGWEVWFPSSYVHTGPGFINATSRNYSSSFAYKYLHYSFIIKHLNIQGHNSI